MRSKRDTDGESSSCAARVIVGLGQSIVKLEKYTNILQRIKELMIS